MSTACTHRSTERHRQTQTDGQKCFASFWCACFTLHQENCLMENYIKFQVLKELLWWNKRYQMAEEEGPVDSIGQNLLEKQPGWVWRGNHAPWRKSDKIQNILNENLGWQIMFKSSHTLLYTRNWKLKVLWDCDCDFAGWNMLTKSIQNVFIWSL